MGRDAGRCCHAINDGRRGVMDLGAGMCVAAGARARAATALPGVACTPHPRTTLPATLNTTYVLTARLSRLYISIYNEIHCYNIL